MVKEFMKDKKKMGIAGGVLALVIAIIAIPISVNATMKVAAYTTDAGNLSSVLEANGNVEADICKTYYSKVDGIVGHINYKVGDFVHAGDVLVTYDADELAKLTSIAELGAEAQTENYNASIQSGNRVGGLYGEATRNIKVLDQQIADTQAALTLKENELLEKKSDLADMGAKLQISLIDWSDEPDSDEYENLQKLVQTNAYEQQYGEDIVRLQEEIDSLNVTLAGYKEYKAEMTSQKASTQMNLMTDGAKKELEARKAANEIVASANIDNYKEAAEGIKAEFDGIISSINVIEGQSIGEGAEIVTLKSLDEVVVTVNLNKYDIVNVNEGQTAVVTIKNKDYTGKVSRIAKIADTASGNCEIDAEVKLDEPDSDIILGIEAKVKICVADYADAIRVPVKALWEDEEGSFVFVYRDGKAYKTEVEVGARNDEMAEIRSGLEIGDVVVWNETSEITDGMSVKADI